MSIFRPNKSFTPMVPVEELEDAHNTILNLTAALAQCADKDDTGITQYYRDKYHGFKKQLAEVLKTMRHPVSGVCTYCNAPREAMHNSGCIVLALAPLLKD